MPLNRKRADKGTDRKEFYREALSEAERMRLPNARKVEGLDEEIALLRVRLFRAAQERPESLDLLVHGISMLVRAVATRYRLSPQAQQDLAGSIEGVINGIGRSLGMEEFSGAPER